VLSSSPTALADSQRRARSSPRHRMARSLARRRARPAGPRRARVASERKTDDRRERGVEHHAGAQRVRDGQDPLAHRNRRRDAIDEVSGEVGRATPDAGGTEPEAAAYLRYRSASAIPNSPAVRTFRTPTIVRSPEPESESPLNHRRDVRPWRAQPSYGVTERHAPPRPSGGKVGEGEHRKGARRAPRRRLTCDPDCRGASPSFTARARESPGEVATRRRHQCGSALSNSASHMAIP
jgi:hypothetical protein